MTTTELATGERGSGPTVLFVHGLDDDSSCWSAVIEELESDHRCVTADLPGHGRSPAPIEPGAYEREAILNSLDSVIEATGAAVLVGHSLGGYLGLAHVLTRPGALDGLVLVATGPGFRDAKSRERWNDRVRENAPGYGVSPTAATAAQHVDSFVIDNLDRVEIPVGLVVGIEDRAFSGANRYLERKLDDVELTEIDGGRHFVMRTHPIEVAAAVRRLVARTP